ncbi:FAD-dependent oxidoreductase [Tsukamurella sp. 1534]|uniref:FAD-dependent oxidoreductase n=1 Tax=Tsukamurella sp. 1534 TaxID=1151061 RepID=UPI00030D3F06|nr:FAD-dependent oxidoreductase [Tsukamurella sp. 1534]
MHVLIAGAGIAGLATALRLTRDGHRVTIVERAPARRSGGYLVNLLGSGFDAAEALDLVSALREHDQGVFTSNLVRTDGTTRLRMPAALAETSLGDRAITLFRGDLESVLYESVRERAELRFGTTVTAVSDHGADPVRVTLSDDTALDADLVIGADGLHSGVRRLVFGPDSDAVVPLDHVVGAVPLDSPPAGLAEQTADTFIDVGRTAAAFRPRGHRASVFFTYRTNAVDHDLAAGPAAAVAERFGDLGGGLGEALDRAGDAGDVYFDAVSHVVLPSWSRGRVALLGDAAWCVSLFAGHGAGLALAGADRLGAALA